MTTVPTGASPHDSLAMLLRVLKLPTIARHAEEVAQTAEHQGWSFGNYLRHLAALEVEERRRRRIERNLRASDLPAEKIMATLDRYVSTKMGQFGREFSVVRSRSRRGFRAG